MYGKAKYVVPTISPAKAYITEFEEIDVAVGFSNFEEIGKYLGTSRTQDLGYDIIMVDTDNIEGFENFRLQESNKNYFVTSFDGYSLKRGLEVFAGLEQAVNLSKVYFSQEILKEEDDYLNFLSSSYKISWGEKIYFPIENGDLSVIYENQRVAKIKFRKLSIQYKDGLAYLAEEIMGDSNDTQVRKAIKFIEKGV